VPFIRRCELFRSDGSSFSAFMVNINVLGAYVALDEQPPLGERLACRFRMPGNEREIAVGAVVAWLNPRQQHPVHSLPPGVGLKFETISEADRSRIEAFVEEYAHAHRSSARP
jgi:Tfp pilus assembly protein PilZ